MMSLPASGCEQLLPWLELRRARPVGPLLCVINDAARGRHWSPRRGTRRAAAHCRPLGIASVYLQGIDSGEISETVHARRAPMQVARNRGSPGSRPARGGVVQRSRASDPLFLLYSPRAHIWSGVSPGMDGSPTNDGTSIT
jgi:hypothetical protein